MIHEGVIPQLDRFTKMNAKSAWNMIWQRRGLNPQAPICVSLVLARGGGAGGANLLALLFCPNGMRLQVEFKVAPLLINSAARVYEPILCSTKRS